MKKVLFVIYQSPVGTIWPNEGFRTAFGMYAADIEPDVLLIDQGAIVVGTETEPAKLGLLPIKVCQKYIKKYETKVWVEKESLEKFNVRVLDQEYNAEIISRADVKAMLAEYDRVVFM
mgnify:CR=1 FL=1|jgi:tRNA 2-thiouridine synthesizing protein C